MSKYINEPILGQYVGQLLNSERKKYIDLKDLEQSPSYVSQTQNLHFRSRKYTHQNDTGSKIL